MTRVARISLLVAGTLAVVVLTAYLLFIRSWLAMPSVAERDEIDRRWVEAEEWAEPLVIASNGDANLPLLRSTTAVVRQYGELIGKVLYDEPAEAALDPASLPPALVKAVEALVTWDRAGGGIGKTSCAPVQNHVEPIPILRLADLAIALSVDGDDPRLVAALRLGSELRRHGTLIEAAVGVSIAENAATWARRRQIAPTGALLRYRPFASEVFPALARDLVCGHRWVDATLNLPNSQGQFFPQEPPMFLRFVSMQRESVMMKRWFADQLHAAHPHANDLPKMAEALRLPPKEKLPRSLVVRIYASDTSRIIERLDLQIRKYDAMIAAAEFPEK